MKIIIFDRDGVINIDHGYVHTIEKFDFNEGIFEIMQYLQEKGFKLYIATGQSGIGRGYYNNEDFNKLNNHMLEEFKKKNIIIEGIFMCPHNPDDDCECRKPKIGMVKHLFEQNNIDKENSYSIGDKDSDTLLGKTLGIKTIRVKSRYDYNEKADFEINKIIKIKSIIK